jgi:hypothetical protein
VSMQDEDQDQLSTEEQQLTPSIQAQLRQGRKAARDLEARNVRDAQREKMDAVVAAGVPNHPARDVVFKDYDGPMDADSIKAFAEKFGIVAAPEPVTAAPTAEEIAAQRAILNAGGGAPAASGDVDLAVALRNAKSQREVMAIVEQVAGNPGFHNRDGLIGVMPEPI